MKIRLYEWNVISSKCTTHFHLHKYIYVVDVSIIVAQTYYYKYYVDTSRKNPILSNLISRTFSFLCRGYSLGYCAILLWFWFSYESPRQSYLHIQIEGNIALYVDCIKAISSIRMMMMVSSHVKIVLLARDWTLSSKLIIIYCCVKYENYSFYPKKFHTLIL